uniref:Uncharacterized protein n=1 Tax=Quercus lobata TaxID=97700 RepID=A0A7N2R105_QUELO
MRINGGKSRIPSFTLYHSPTYYLYLNTPKPALFSVLHSMAEILSPPISHILLLAYLRQCCELRFVKMYWQCMRRRRRKRHHFQNGIWNGMVRKDLQVSLQIIL